jgi:hypothetical protein
MAMGNALAQTFPQDEAIPRGAVEMALRLALEEARQLAAQSRLLALNAAFESAGAAASADAPGGAVGQAAAEADRVTAVVELLLQQIQSASSLSRPL